MPPENSGGKTRRKKTKKLVAVKKNGLPHFAADSPKASIFPAAPAALFGAGFAPL